MTDLGILSTSHLYDDAIGLPAAMVGLGLGVLVFDRLDQQLFGRLVVLGLLITGVIYVARSTAELLADDEHGSPDHHQGFTSTISMVRQSTFHTDSHDATPA